jgi:hypothetical protein
MTQYKPIKRFCKKLHSKMIEHWEEDKDNLTDKSKFEFYPYDGYLEFTKLKPNHPLYNLIKFPIPYRDIMYIKNPARVGLGPIHVDVSRKCALNIPIQVNTNFSFIFIAKDEEKENCIKLSSNSGIPPQDPERYDLYAENPRFYHYEPEKYDFYDLRSPALVNTQTPHSGANFSDEPRVLLSISFTQPFDHVSRYINQIV